MADKTTGGLPAVEEAAIGSLPGIADLYDDTLLPVEQQGEAMHMTGRQWKKYAQASVEDYVDGAEEAAKAAASSAAAAAKSAESAAGSADDAAGSAQSAKEYSGKPPVIRDGTWWTWDAVRREYVDTGEAARGETGPVGPQGIQGIQGIQGVQGETGAGIQSIERTGGDGSPGTVDTYTITMTDGSTDTFTVYNGADGTSFTVLGRYDTLDALQAAHPAGSEGDAWAVGSAEDNDIYLWNVDTQAWQNIGSLQGPPGPQGPAGRDGMDGKDGAPGADGKDGEQGPPGLGIAEGGTAGQVLVKNSDEDYDTKWTDPPKSGVTSFNGRNGEVVSASGDYRVEQVTGAAPKESPEFTGSISLGRNPSSEIGDMSVALGKNTVASGECAVSEGSLSTASGRYSHAEGTNCTASGNDSHAEGFLSHAFGHQSHASGVQTIAEYVGECAIGCFNVKKNVSEPYYAGKDLFAIGKGDSVSTRANIFRVDHTAVYGTGSFNTSGADYAELFEWLDGNLENTDRCGRFVTLEGEKIRLAGPRDDFVLGIVSGNPSVVGNVHDDQWKGMYLYDVFGRSLWEDVEVPDVTVEEPDPEDPEKTITRVIIPAHMEHRQRLNPAYDGSQPYQPRTQRPEWDAVGMLGKLVAVDDGTCQVNGWCTVVEGGAATHSTQRTRYRVMSRLDECHVRVLIL